MLSVVLAESSKRRNTLRYYVLMDELLGFGGFVAVGHQEYNDRIVEWAR